MRPSARLAAAEKIERGFLGKMLRLTLLAPNLVEAIMDGRQGVRVDLAACKQAPSVWAEQAAGAKTAQIGR